ncbi:MAG: hypothetical protein ACE5OQ_07585 [Woeseia sp.]
MPVNPVRLLLVWILLGGCAGTAQLSTNTDSVDFSLDPVAFRDQGLGFLTPVSATGQEADRVALALAFADTVAAQREDLHVVRLAEVLSSVNQAALSDEYKTMVNDYHATGILEKDTLRRVGEVSGARYLGLLGLAEFSQTSNRRVSVAGIRLFDTKLASIRLSLQVWDSQTGTIAWEGSDEIDYAYDTGRERPVNFGFVAEQAATNLIAEIPVVENALPQVSALTGLAGVH